MTGIYTQKDPSNPWWMEWFVRPLARSFINDMILMENIVTKSNICYTIVRPPGLTKGTLWQCYQFYNIIQRLILIIHYVLRCSAPRNHVKCI